MRAKGLACKNLLTGFSLLELMIAMALFSFALIGIFKIVIYSSALLDDAFLKNRALYAAISNKELKKTNIENKEKQQLIKSWSIELKKQFPGISYNPAALKLESDTIRLTWRSSLNINICEFQNKVPKDCINF